MKKIYFAFFFFACIITQTLSAQPMQWLTSVPVNYSFNPDALQQPSFVSGNKIFSTRLSVFDNNFGSDIYGTQSIDCYDTSGTMNWSFALGPKAIVRTIIADAAGNVFIAGSFMETFHVGANDSLTNTGSGFDTNLFLVSIDVAGNLRWKRNVTLSHPDAFNLSAFAIDPMENCWYGLEYFDSISVKRLDVNGNDAQSYVVLGTRTLGSFSFDPAGNMFLAGSSGSQMMVVNGVSAAVTEPYMMFVARIDASGNGSWIKLMHDVTFQSPQVVATASGHAYLAGNLMDGATFGTVVFDGPQWVYDIFLTRIDSAGNFLWGVEVPLQQTITGDFQRGKDNFLDADAGDNVYMTGYIRGVVDWGNGVISDAGTIPSDGMAVVSFDANGTPRWQKTGKATGYVTPYSLCVTAPDECYFAASAIGTTTFDSLTTNTGGNLALVLGKISTQSASGINDLESETLSLYPNPADHFLMVKPNENNAAVEIYNALGEKVFHAEKVRSSVDVSFLPDGMYLVIIGSSKAKFIVRHK